MIRFILLFIFISTFSFSQNMDYYWNDAGITIQQLFSKMGIPDDTEYQNETDVYWFAYDFGEVAVIYIVNKGFVSGVLYMKNSGDYISISNAFSKNKDMAKSSGFSVVDVGERHFNAQYNNIQLTGNITHTNNEYVLTILAIRIK